MFLISGPTEYIPGTPGGPWTAEEIDIVRERIFQFINPTPEAKKEMFGGRKVYHLFDGPISGKMQNLGLILFKKS